MRRGANGSEPGGSVPRPADCEPGLISRVAFFFTHSQTIDRTRGDLQLCDWSSGCLNRRTM